MSAKPTRRQWRGYVVLGVVLVAAALVFVFSPVETKQPVADNHSRLKEAIDNYGDSILVQKTSAGRNRKEKSFHRYSSKTDTYRGNDAQNSQNPQKHKIRDGDKELFDNRYDQKYNCSGYHRPMVDINAADTTEMQLLYGIGPAFARRIVRYRQRLGGYVRKEQLLEVYGMDSVRYEGFADNVIVDGSSVVKLDINNATVDELKRHPYLDYYQARSIVDYRKKGKHFETMEDLKMVNLIDTETVRKLQGYIQFN